MYYGYMQRGLSLITLFCASFMLGALAGPLVVTMFIVWMFSFFDTYDPDPPPGRRGPPNPIPCCFWATGRI